MALASGGASYLHHLTEKQRSKHETPAIRIERTVAHSGPCAHRTEWEEPASEPGPVEMFAFVVLLVVMTNASSRNHETNGDGADVFKPCAPLNPVPIEKKLRLIRIGKSMVQKCAYSVVTKKRVPIGVNFLKIAPLLDPKLCYFFLPIFNYWPGKPNCLPREVRRNFSAVFELGLNLAKAYAAETSIENDFCLDGACVRKKHVYEVFVDWATCFLKVFNDVDDTLFRCAEDLISITFIIVKIIRKSGIFQFHTGSVDGSLNTTRS